MSDNDTKLCPYCAEEIRSAAVVCKHCGRELPGFEETIKNLEKSEIGDEVVEEPTRQEPLKEGRPKPKKTVVQKSINFSYVLFGLNVIASFVNNF